MRVSILTRDRALQDALAKAVRRLGYDACLLDSAADIPADASFSAAIVDDGLPDLAGVVALLRERTRRAGLVVLSGRSDPRSVVEAFGLGADEVLRKPFDLRALGRVLRSITHCGAPARAPRIVAVDKRMESALRTLERAADSDLTVTLCGETGTGRSLLARWLHAHSSRRNAPLVEISALELEESRCLEDLCGAPSNGDGVLARPGRLEQAHGGTLVLDGIEDFPARAQEVLPSLLHGDDSRIDARVVAIAGKPLDQFSCQQLPEPLRERLQVLEVEIPPLRERLDDVPALAEAFLEHAAREAGTAPALIDAAAAASLRERAWRGNVRELENLMARAAVVFPGTAIRLDWIERSLQSTVEPGPAGLNLRQIERAAIVRSLHLTGGSRTEAARALGISVRTLRNKIQRYGLL